MQCKFFIFVTMLLPIIAKNHLDDDDGAQPTEEYRARLLKLHPFLKHRTLSKDMQDLMLDTRRKRSGLVKVPTAFEMKQVPFSMKPSYYWQQLTTTTANYMTINPKLLRVHKLSQRGLQKRQNDSQEFCLPSNGSEHEPVNNSNLQKVLGQVLQDVKCLKFGKGTPRRGNCNITGNWIAEIAGRQINVACTQNDGPVTIKLTRPVQKRRLGFMGNGEWVAQGLKPFRSKLNYIQVIAINRKEKLIAIFMGECLICKNRELVQGEWVLNRHSRDCASLGATTAVYGDVWRQDTTNVLKNKHMGLAGVVNNKNKPTTPVVVACDNTCAGDVMPIPRNESHVSLT